MKSKHLTAGCRALLNKLPVCGRGRLFHVCALNTSRHFSFCALICGACKAPLEGAAGLGRGEGGGFPLGMSSVISFLIRSCKDACINLFCICCFQLCSGNKAKISFLK